MDKHKLENNENTDNIEKDDNAENNKIINKLYSNVNIPKKQNPTPEYVGVTKFKDIEESEKYIKEMHDLADKNEFKNTLVVTGLAIFVIVIVAFSIIMNTSFAKNITDTAKNDVVTKTPNDTTSTEGNVNTPSETSPDVLSQTPSKLYEYLNIEENRVSVLKKAVELNGGSQKGITVYLLSEILRANTYDIPEKTSSVKELLTELTSMGFKKNTDFTQLEKGDICFTIDMPDSPGTPSHAYIFMGWVEDDKTDYANICDGQVEEFGNILHKRNLSIETAQKDKFSFFLEK
ncbi:hypothetical protein LGK97_00620 [Clostridium sp. CS001]|uniref:hypothetical protein n=1 Tax=Clostridium sp. CS001 TaxID=2880648 RepID=UPI001CF1D785|nr:hypothetical protein [Clostridium sp. CS001]MCB2288267.1 hypothetical protein [Clostridium sp. CS001]